MSTFCLDLQASAAVSAPLELDSDCMEPRDGAAAQEPGGVQGHQLRRTGSGGLGVALEEELAMLTGQRDDEDDLSGLEAPAAAQNSELLSLFRQKEKDLVLAAKLGKALLERNQDLTKQYEKMHKDLNDKLEHLEQEKHELRRRLESREGEWEGRVAELETDVQHLQGELERHQVQLREADRDKTKAISELSEQNHRLLEQLSRDCIYPSCSGPGGHSDQLRTGCGELSARPELGTLRSTGLCCCFDGLISTAVNGNAHTRERSIRYKLLPDSAWGRGFTV
ncbi:BICD family-like cargo adapter 1 [Takifugu flavidus]|uniref:BICD family-like cargo adapter 1 n=1 Tax=Takifugu flavidus TaxID=433684 RepID=A0A5C6N0A0_9TELE|nr:BICD family-like cargo adapter 1 [Takifugu flavidus]